MHKIDGSGHLNGAFVAEDPQNNLPGTLITAEWLNAVQEEIANVIFDAGLNLSKPDNTQLLEAIKGSNSLTINGYQRLLGGFILQWGTQNAVNDAQPTNVLFPIAFPTQCLCVVAVHVHPGGPVSRIVEASVQSSTYFNVRSNSTANAIYWIAVGN